VAHAAHHRWPARRRAHARATDAANLTAPTGPLSADETLAALLARLATSARGLSASDAARRLAAGGANELAAHRWRTKVLELVRPIANPLILILLAAGTASAFVGEVADALLIGVIVLLSAGLNAWQTVRSARAVGQLQAQISPTATVRRDDAWVDVPRGQVVTGDVVRLSAGAMVPADARLLEATDLHVQQADIVERLAARPDETEFERGMRTFGMLILETVTVLVMFILIVNVSLGRDPLAALLFSVALAVGLTPEFLPMITTVTLAQGAVAMAREKVIVKHLSSIQNLGSIDVLCSDKTGTLTAGTMTLDAALDAFGQPSERALAVARLNSRFETGIESPLDAAILEHASLDDGGFAKTDEVPFDFERRRMSVVVAQGARYQLVTKGAPESVLAACAAYEHEGAVEPLDPATAERCRETFRALSERGYRVLAVAYREVPHPSGYTAADERELTLVGFVTFADHLLAGVGDALDRLHADGVGVKILTGDNELVSRHICEQVGLAVGVVVVGDEVERMDDLALARVAERTTLFARVSPAQKHRIIRALKADGHVVGFLGDGINDAPSLHGADVGISVAGAVDVAREAADIILLERRLDVLHAGILAGRRSFGNVLKYLLMGTSSNFGNMLSMAGAALFLPFLPMLPTQILLNNFLYDLAQVTIPTDRVDPQQTKLPQRWDIKVIRRFMLVIGPVSSAFDVLTFLVLLQVFHFGATLFHTGWFVESLATQALVLFVIRTAGRPWRHRPSTPLIATTLAVVTIGALLPFSPLAPVLGFAALPARYFGFLVVVVGTYLAVVELVKRHVIRGLHVQPAARHRRPRAAMKPGIIGSQ